MFTLVIALAVATAASPKRAGPQVVGQGFSPGLQAEVTFTKDVAPIIFDHCSACHRPGEIGPFSLLTYEEIRPRAAAIARATETRSMPPWKPEPGYGGELIGTRRLTDRQVETIRRWVRGGALEGDRRDMPPAPTFTEGWRLGQPDLVLTMTEPYTLSVASGDVLRNFVIPIPTQTTRYVRGIEFRPGNRRVVHHANLRIDRTGAARRADVSDRDAGFDGLITAGNFPDGHFLGWTPAQLPPLFDERMAWRLDPGSDLVLQLHMMPADTPQTVQPSIGFFFAEQAPTHTPMMLRLGRQNIDLAPGRREYVSEDRYALPVDVEVHGVQPHAHFRAKQIEGFATLPDGTKKWLIYIKDWDFNWQDAYRYAQPFVLPKGTVLGMRYTYDNSSANRRNPDRPPRRVRWGQNSADEMGDLWIQVLPRTNEDRETLRADFAPKVMAEDAIGYEKMLEGDPKNARLHEAAAAIYLSLDRTERAVGHLREALIINPASAEAHYNLATALVRQGRLDDAVQHLERTLQIQPDHVAAHVNLGAVLRRRSQFDGAISHLRRALQLDARNAAAHTNLAGALAAEHHVAEALPHYRLALQVNPDLIEALTDLAWLLATSGDAAIREPVEAVRLAERADTLTKRNNVRVLDTLAAAYAAAGQFVKAVEAAQAAIRLAESAGVTPAVDQLRERLNLYRRNIPFRRPEP